MPLAQKQLDDLTWNEMVQAARSRIAAVSQEHWTHHAPVDPGVTLLELFAHLLEQRVYWLDQIPDTLLHAIVALHGGQIAPARAAATLLELDHVDMSTAFAEGTTFWRRDRQSVSGFTTTGGVQLLPVERIDVQSAFGSVSTSLEPAPRSGSPRWAATTLPLLGAHGAPAEFQITLWLRGPLPAFAAGQPCSLLLELAAPERIAPQWSPDAVDDVSPPARIDWSYSVPGGEQRLAQAAVDDGTQALRRSGTVRFEIPSTWTPVQAAVNGLSPYLLWARVDAATFSAPPELRRIVPNVAVATHQIPIDLPWSALERQVAQWLPLPDLFIQLPDLLHPPEGLVLPDYPPPIEDSVKLELKGRDGVWRAFERTQDFARLGPTDAAVTVDRLLKRIEFGDGLTGQLPVLDPGSGPTVRLSYLAGGGVAGNLGSNLRWEAHEVPGLLGHNPIPSRGGREAESASEAKMRMAAELQTRERAVTLADFAELAVGTPGVAVARAQAFAGDHPCFPCVTVPGAVTVFIVPEVPRHAGWLDSDLAVTAPLPDEGMLSEVRNRLGSRRLVTTEVFVRAAVYRRVRVEATLAGVSIDRLRKEAELRAGLTLFLDPLVGGADDSGWSFGEPLRLSELTHELQQLLGDDATVESVAAGLDDDDTLEACDDVAILPHELVVLHSLLLRWQSPAAARGGLR